HPGRRTYELAILRRAALAAQSRVAERGRAGAPRRRHRMPPGIHGVSPPAGVPRLRKEGFAPSDGGRSRRRPDPAALSADDGRRAGVRRRQPDPSSCTAAVMTEQIEAKRVLVSIVVPVLNEETNIRPFYEQLSN